MYTRLQEFGALYGIRAQQLSSPSCIIIFLFLVSVKLWPILLAAASLSYIFLWILMLIYYSSVFKSKLPGLNFRIPGHFFVPSSPATAVPRWP